ncbi:MAG: 4a-hydroxytetrahydrobiopterin dehydratase [bacterium]|nr:4a-hydroxytetrahydrobiopterin dehydratase [bacterium]
MSLVNKHCVPCEGGVAPLVGVELNNYLNEAKNWSLSEDSKKISRDFVFKNFKQALDFVNKIGAVAETQQHHPDIFLHEYKLVAITLWTHAIGGLSENDFIMAAKIDQLV